MSKYKPKKKVDNFKIADLLQCEYMKELEGMSKSVGISLGICCHPDIEDENPYIQDKLYICSGYEPFPIFCPRRKEVEGN